MRRALFLLIGLLALAGCGGDGGSRSDYGTSTDALPTSTEATPADGLEEIANVLDLRSAVEADKGKTRLLILFSPT